MGVYGAAGDAYRDTTKWLAAAVPVATLVGAGVTLGPKLVQSIQGAVSLRSWVGGHALVLLAGVVLAGGVTWILWTGAAVLSAGPALPVELVRDPDGVVGTAIGAGVALPYYDSAPSFVADLDAWLGEGGEEARGGGKAEGSEGSPLDRLGPAMVAISEWSALHTVETRFAAFRRAFAVSTVCIVGAVLLAAAQLPSGAAVSSPTAVVVEVGQPGADELWAATGCTDPMRSTYTAIGGTWDAPVLSVDGPGCRLGATWTPSRGAAGVRVATPGS